MRAPEAGVCGYCHARLGPLLRRADAGSGSVRTLLGHARFFKILANSVCRLR